MRGNGGLTCTWCKQPICPGDGRQTVHLATGLMHGECHLEHWQKVQTLIAAAIEAGTHTNEPPAGEPENNYQRAGRLSAGFAYSTVGATPASPAGVK